MRILFLLLLSFTIFACHKDNLQKTIISAEILKSGKWFLAETHLKTFNNTSNTIVKDTAMFSDSCIKTSFIGFRNDSVCYKNTICLTGLPETEGKWFLKSDSLFYVYIPGRISYGTGYLIINSGIEPSKLLNIHNDFFTVRKIEQWHGFSNGVYSTCIDTTTSIYRKY